MTRMIVRLAERPALRPTGVTVIFTGGSVARSLAQHGRRPGAGGGGGHGSEAATEPHTGLARGGPGPAR
jgi:hypothetical protein